MVELLGLLLECLRPGRRTIWFTPFECQVDVVVQTTVCRSESHGKAVV